VSVLLARSGVTFRWSRAVAWALSWGVGAALGVAAGAWLTVVGEAGAPGVGSIDPGMEFVTLPLAALVVVSAVHLGGQVVAGMWRGARHKRAA
jgi:hypothetical protein